MSGRAPHERRSGAVLMSRETSKSDHVGRWRGDGVDFYSGIGGRTGAICGGLCANRERRAGGRLEEAAGLSWGSSGSVGGGWRGLRVAV